ncbi:hypothetical protein F0344_16205 [Streptomyces finlayi]|uniref:Uncharacterized protein n=1 Tax=Streptomyces finlayi TaxID=67296 RepID=A0A7G7BKV8_9ACTN|nr:hypothetical protein [Streptomyces finlayi]QNE75973.1 hypothetical protein F0344_16205 [Streptomyces finlayi]
MITLEEPARPSSCHGLAPINRGGTRKRRRRALVGGLVTVAVVATVLVATLSTDRPNGSGEGSQSLSVAESIACAETIVEGDVLAIRDTRPPEPKPDDWLPHITVTLAVKDWIKPLKGPKRLDVDIAAPWEGKSPIATGERLLIKVWNHPGISNQSYRAGQLKPTRESLARWLPTGMKTSCPDFWTHPKDRSVPGDS